MVSVINTFLWLTQSFSSEKLSGIITPVRMICMLRENLIEVEVSRICS